MTAGHESAAAATSATGDDAARLRLIIAEKKWVGFDLDDTLHEFRRASSAAAGQVFDAISQRHALSVPQLKAAYSEILREKTAGAFADGKTSFDYRRIRFSALLAHFSVQPDDAFLETLLQLYESALTASLELKAGAVGLLSKIKRSGRQVVIITEGPQDAQERTVEALGIRPVRNLCRMSEKHAWKVDLVPWDPNSDEHVTRLFDQRTACGWRADEVLAQDHPDRDKLLALHFAEYPQCGAGLGRRREHRSTRLDTWPSTSTPSEDEAMGLPPTGVTWLHQLYVSYALQKGGLGAAAMANAERIARLEPYNASIMALDTLQKKIQLSDTLQKVVYDDRGLPRRTVANEDWYQRMGYEIFAETSEGYVLKHLGGALVLEVAFLKRACVRLQYMRFR
ncbi:unnamed protein product [Parascedosporium putredinis]|uniref:Uncharacterized protein n=1 Tax=Parascedosporium putredinis TaxID=1442378 RepID=A0A9P1GX80_9PEZI|nr:unnamed protein product [Parascedosporium putredinis]CAI7990306.1 unnamed protein product [Parascedosporium putredinis]